jgi:hypothetical protein
MTQPPSKQVRYLREAASHLYDAICAIKDAMAENVEGETHIEVDRIYNRLDQINDLVDRIVVRHKAQKVVDDGKPCDV